MNVYVLGVFFWRQANGVSLQKIITF